MLGKQNIAIRGHVEEESNFNATLTLMAKKNSILHNHLEKATPAAKYTSPEIQNEILYLAAKQILDIIIADCKKSVLRVHRQ